MSARFINFVVIYKILSFLRLNKTPSCVCVCDIFINHLFTDRYWSCFHVLAIVNSASMNIRVHIYLRNTDCTSSECTPRSVIIGLYKNYKTLMKKIEEPCRWKVILCSCFGRVNVIYLCFFFFKYPYYPKKSTDSLWYQWKFQAYFSQKEGKKSWNLYGTAEDPK